MYLTHLLSSAFAILFGILLLTWIIPGYTPEYPGYGMPASLLPDILAWIIVVSAALNLVRTIVTGTGKGEPSPLTGKRFLHLISFTAVLAAAMPLMRELGYFAGGALVMTALCLLCGERKPIRLAAVAAVTLAVVWAALWKGLSVMLPGM